MTTKSPHEKKLDELEYLLGTRVAAETKAARIGCFGTLLCTAESAICKECADFEKCLAELEKTRKTQVIALDEKCKKAAPKAKKKKEKAQPEAQPETPESKPEAPEAPKTGPKKGTVNWPLAIAQVIKEQPANYAEMTSLLKSLLKEWGGLEISRYRKFKEIAFSLRDKGLIEFDDYKLDTFIWK